MKRKIVMNVQMPNEKDKSKAMKIVVSVDGVISVSVAGENLEIIGGVDSVFLANSLRKKFPYTDIVKETKSQESSPPPSSDTPPPYPVYNYCYPPPCPPAYYYDPGPPNCSIM